MLASGLGDGFDHKNSERQTRQARHHVISPYVHNSTPAYSILFEDVDKLLDIEASPTTEVKRAQEMYRRVHKELVATRARRGEVPNFRAPVQSWIRDAWQHVPAWIETEKLPTAVGESVVVNWVFDLPESLDAFRLVVDGVYMRTGKVWPFVPRGQFAAAFLQSITFEELKTIDIVTLDHLEALLMVKCSKEALFTKVLLNKERKPDYRVLIQHFARIALQQQDLDKEWILEAIYACGVHMCGVDWLISMGYLDHVPVAMYEVD